MVESKRSLADKAMQVAREMARTWFLRDDHVEDCVSVAWELAQTGRGNAVSIAVYAVKRVRSGRHLRQTVRSIDSPIARDRHSVRVPFDVLDVARKSDDPATIAAFRIDFQQWLDGLPATYRQIVEALASGERTLDASRRFGVTPGRISQIRRALAESWSEMHGEL